MSIYTFYLYNSLNQWLQFKFLLPHFPVKLGLVSVWWVSLYAGPFGHRCCVEQDAMKGRWSFPIYKGPTTQLWLMVTFPKLEAEKRPKCQRRTVLLWPCNSNIIFADGFCSHFISCCFTSRLKARVLPRSNTVHCLFEVLKVAFNRHL